MVGDSEQALGELVAREALGEAQAVAGEAVGGQGFEVGGGGCEGCGRAGDVGGVEVEGLEEYGDLDAAGGVQVPEGEEGVEFVGAAVGLGAA